MQKPRSGSLKKVSQIYNTHSHILFLKSILLAAVCFSFCPAALAQRNSLDNQAVMELMEHRTQDGTAFHQGISNSTGYLSLSVPITVLTVGLLTHDKTTLHKGLYIAESFAVSTLITYGLKYTINRNRPFMKNSLIIPEGAGGGPSFPSGHTSQAFSTATALTIAYPKWYVAVPAFAWATTVGYSRIYLGMHYPTDVVAGAIVGAGSAWLTYKANQWLRGNKPKALRTVF